MADEGLRVSASVTIPDGRDRIHGHSLAGRRRAERQQGGERGAAAVRRGAARACYRRGSRERLLALRDHRISADGVVVIKAQQFRSQEQNKAAALERLAELVRRALVVPKVRRKTKPTRASQAAPARQQDQALAAEAAAAARSTTDGALRPRHLRLRRRRRRQRAHRPRRVRRVHPLARRALERRGDVRAFPRARALAECLACRRAAHGASRCRPARSSATRADRDRVLREQVQPVDGMREVLEGLTIPYCIASSGGHDKMRITLGATKLMPLFEGRLFSATEVPRGKPAPDIFLFAARAHGREPGAHGRHRGLRERRARGLRGRHDGVRVRRPHGGREAHRRRRRARVHPHARAAGTARLIREPRASVDDRGQRVMLASDLARLYEVTTGNLNLAVRRNAA